MNTLEQQQVAVEALALLEYARALMLVDVPLRATRTKLGLQTITKVQEDVMAIASMISRAADKIADGHGD